MATPQFARSERHTIAVETLLRCLAADPRLGRIKRDFLRSRPSGPSSAVREHGKLWTSKVMHKCEGFGAPATLPYGEVLMLWALSEVQIGFSLEPWNQSQRVALAIDVREKDSLADIRRATLAALDTALTEHGLSQAATTRRVKDAGHHVTRDVRWLYQHRIADPPTTVSSIAREYAATARRTTDARSVVQTGISRAETLLARVPK